MQLITRHLLTCSVSRACCLIVRLHKQCGLWRTLWQDVKKKKKEVWHLIFLGGMGQAERHFHASFLLVQEVDCSIAFILTSYKSPPSPVTPYILCLITLTGTEMWLMAREKRRSETKSQELASLVMHDWIFPSYFTVMPRLPPENTSIPHLLTSKSQLEPPHTFTLTHWTWNT